MRTDGQKQKDRVDVEQLSSPSGAVIYSAVVWVLPFAENSRLWIIIILSYLVGLGHFSHVVAGAVQTFFVAVAGQASWGAVVGNYLVPTLIGNVIGGVALVAAINHAQVVSGAKGEHPILEPDREWIK